MKFDQEDLIKRISSSLRGPLDINVKYLVGVLKDVCESPIEIALGAALLTADQLEHEYLRLNLMLATPGELERWRDDLALVIPQFQWGKYRIDFALRLPKYRFRYLFVECDGHDFHERTKEQAARDRSRDRDIQQAGYPVLRFTGSEIHRNAGECGQRIIDFVNDRYDDRIPR
jgi:very-short-patch-repair endonuclease